MSGSLPRPVLGEDVPRVPKPVMADLRASTSAHYLDDLRRAFGKAQDLLERDESEEAVEVMRWAKSVAAKSWAVREAFGLALYTNGQYREAHSELLAYRRFSGRHDQNHVLADCARALERWDKVGEFVRDMREADVAEARVAEGVMVLAAAQADEGNVEGALATLEEYGLAPERIQPWHARLWYLAGDLAEELGDAGRARELFSAVVAVGDLELDAQERLAGLDERA